MDPLDIGCLQEPCSAASALLEHTRQEQAKQSKSANYKKMWLLVHFVVFPLCCSTSQNKDHSFLTCIIKLDCTSNTLSGCGASRLDCLLVQVQDGFGAACSDLPALPCAGAATTGSCSLCQAGAYQTGSGQSLLRMRNQRAMGTLRIRVAA